MKIKFDNLLVIISVILKIKLTHFGAHLWWILLSTMEAVSGNCNVDSFIKHMVLPQYKHSVWKAVKNITIIMKSFNNV